MGKNTGSVSFTVKGDKDVVAALHKLGAAGKKHAKLAVAETAINVQADAKRRAPVDTGALRSSIAIRVRGAYSAEVYTDKLYAAAVEYGRSAGSAMPPTGALDGWLRRKGIDPNASFAVRRSIGEQGVPPRPFMLPAFEGEKGPFKKRMRDALLTATKEVGK